MRSIVDFLNDAIAAENAVHPQPDQSESTGRSVPTGPVQGHPAA